MTLAAPATAGSTGVVVVAGALVVGAGVVVGCGAGRVAGTRGPHAATPIARSVRKELVRRRVMRRGWRERRGGECGRPVSRVLSILRDGLLGTGRSFL